MPSVRGRSHGRIWSRGQKSSQKSIKFVVTTADVPSPETEMVPFTSCQAPTAKEPSQLPCHCLSTWQNLTNLWALSLGYLVAFLGIRGHSA